MPPLPFAAAERTTLNVADVAAPTGLPAAKAPLAGLAALATEVDEQVEALAGAKLLRPRGVVRALEAALNPVVTTATDPAAEDGQTPAAVNEFVKQVTTNPRRGIRNETVGTTEKSEQTDSGDASAAEPSKTKARHTRRHAPEASDGSAQSKADPPSGAKDRGHRGAKHVKAGAKD